MSMSYKEEFKIYCSTIAGEAGGSSDEAIRTVARSIITRIGFREWTSRTNAFEVIKYSGYDAYTDRSSSPNYKVVYSAMSSGKLDNLSKRIIELVEPIYNQKIPDETGMISLYYSPKAQTALHKKNPRKYKERPPWDFSQLERVYIDGTNKDDFNWYRYKGDGSTIRISLLNIVNSSISGKKITIKVTDRLGKYFVKEYKTNNRGEIPDIHARKKSTIEFFVGETSCKTNIIADGKPKKVTLRDYECKFNTTTIPHITIAPTSPATSSSQSENSQGAKDKEQTTINNNSLDEVTFNIKLVEADTGKPLPNTTYHLEYKNNIKSHKTDSSGIESGVTADVSQSIGVYLDDDDGKKQSIYSMSFPVTGDLNGRTKVIKVPVVSFSIKFVDNNNQPIPRYEFKTLYRGRKSAIKRANRQGISTIQALAGQKLTVIDGQDRAQTTAIVTYGSKQWTMIIGTDITEEDISDILSQEASTTPETSKQEDKPKPQTEQNPIIKVEKPKVTEVEKKTETGPTLEVASDEAKITIKFVDEATNKPLSGLSYITQSTKYGKNTSVTGDDGTRGRTHDSLVGIDITVLVYEDGKEVKKDVITASVDRNDIPYVYKAKKPKNYLYPLPIDATADYKSGMRSFGSNRSGGKRKHAGADLYAPTGTTVRAMESGIVLSTGSFYAGTDFVTIKHPNHIIRYGELAPGSIKVEAEDEVARGQPIGAVGKLKGINVPSNMLHLEMYSNTNDTSNLTVKGAAGGKFKRRSDLINPNSFLDNADK